VLSTQPEPATHAEVARLKSLLRDRKARVEDGLFVCEGPRVVAAALEHGAPVATVYVDSLQSELAVRAALHGCAVRTLSAADVRKVGDTRTPQAAFATVRRAPADLAALTGATLSAVCVQVNDPGNAGTLMRSAAAAGAQALGLGPGSVDAYNPKVVRASAGACFAISTVEGRSAVEMLEALGEAGVQRLGAVAQFGPAPEVYDLTQPTTFVLGHETKGLGGVLPLDGSVSIPMFGTESLNVAMAGTVLLFEAARQRRSV
jgi:TrmH family RNA methyltransferase